MPTYTYLCKSCGDLIDVVMSMREYIANPPEMVHCRQPMERHINAAPWLAVASDAIYQGLQAPDGTDISSRAKHKAYMKANNLTTVDDFKDTWAMKAKQRSAEMAGEDPQRVQDIANAIHKLGG